MYGFKLEQAMSFFIQKLMLKKRWTGEEAVEGIVDLTSFRLKVMMLANYVYSYKHINIIFYQGNDIQNNYVYCPISLPLKSRHLTSYNIGLAIFNHGINRQE